MARGFLAELMVLIPNARIILSLPTMTSEYATNGSVIELRNAIRTLAKEIGISYDNNKNFDKKFLAPDGVHPSKQGANLLLGNFRHNIHSLSVKQGPKHSQGNHSATQL